MERNTSPSKPEAAQSILIPQTDQALDEIESDIIWCNKCSTTDRSFLCIFVAARTHLICSFTFLLVVCNDFNTWWPLHGMTEHSTHRRGPWDKHSKRTCVAALAWNIVTRVAKWFLWICEVVHGNLFRDSHVCEGLDGQPTREKENEREIRQIPKGQYRSKFSDLEIIPICLEWDLSRFGEKLVGKICPALLYSYLDGTCKMAHPVPALELMNPEGVFEHWWIVSMHESWSWFLLWLADTKFWRGWIFWPGQALTIWSVPWAWGNNHGARRITVLSLTNHFRWHVHDKPWRAVKHFLLCYAVMSSWATALITGDMTVTAWQCNDVIDSSRGPEVVWLKTDAFKHDMITGNMTCGPELDSEFTIEPCNWLSKAKWIMRHSECCETCPCTNIEIARIWLNRLDSNCCSWKFRVDVTDRI